jgi:hypothetical protein
MYVALAVVVWSYLLAGVVSVVTCVRQSSSGGYEVAMITPEATRELEHHLLDEQDWHEPGYSPSLPCHPDTLKEMGIHVPIKKGLTLADAARFMTLWHRGFCLSYHERFSGAGLCGGGICLMCFTMFDRESPEDPCVVCQEDQLNMHGRLVVECKQCKKHTCMKCRQEQYVVGFNHDCPACRCPGGNHIANTKSVKLCWYTGVGPK